MVSAEATTERVDCWNSKRHQRHCNFACDYPSLFSLLCQSVRPLVLHGHSNTFSGHWHTFLRRRLLAIWLPRIRRTCTNPNKEAAHPPSGIDRPLFGEAFVSLSRQLPSIHLQTRWTSLSCWSESLILCSNISFCQQCTWSRCLFETCSPCNHLRGKILRSWGTYPPSSNHLSSMVIRRTCLFLYHVAVSELIP